jgi:hypothetical protein
MNRNAKIGISVIVAIILLGICTCVGAALYLGKRMVQSFITNPDEIAKMRQEIAEYDVPEGYKEYGMQMFGFQALMLSNYERSPENLVIVKFPTSMEMSQAEIDQAMQQVIQQYQNTVWKVVETQPVTIMDQTITMTILEGGEDPDRVRRMQCGWQGQNGMIALQIYGRVESWDQAVVDTFLASIR